MRIKIKETVFKAKARKKLEFIEQKRSANVDFINSATKKIGINL